MRVLAISVKTFSGSSLCSPTGPRRGTQLPGPKTVRHDEDERAFCRIRPLREGARFAASARGADECPPWEGDPLGRRSRAAARGPNADECLASHGAAPETSRSDGDL